MVNTAAILIGFSLLSNLLQCDLLFCDWQIGNLGYLYVCHVFDTLTVIISRHILDEAIVLRVHLLRGIIRWATMETVGILMLVADCIGFTALLTVWHRYVVGFFAAVIPGLQECTVTVSWNWICSLCYNSSSILLLLRYLYCPSFTYITTSSLHLPLKRFKMKHRKQTVQLQRRMVTWSG